MNYILYDGEVMYVPNMARAFDKLSMDVFSISEMPPHFFAIFLRSCWWWLVDNLEHPCKMSPLGSKNEWVLKITYTIPFSSK